MEKCFQLLAFDWDGTLMDSTRAIVDAVQAACRDLGFAEPPETQAQDVIGLSLANMLSHCVPQANDEEVARMIERYRYHYLSGDHRLLPFDGIAEMLEELKTSGFTLAVATGKSRRGLDRALAASGLGPLFAATRCADECFSKPHPAMLEELMDELDTPPERTLMIGDTTHDLQMAINAGVAGLAVSYGAHEAAVLEALHPLACVDSVEALAGWLRSNAG